MITVALPGPTATLGIWKSLVELVLRTAQFGTQISLLRGVVTMVMEVGHALAWPSSISDIRERPVGWGISREKSKTQKTAAGSLSGEL